jgi:hypothetical protein
LYKQFTGGNVSSNRPTDGLFKLTLVYSSLQVISTAKVYKQVQDSQIFLQILKYPHFMLPGANPTIASYNASVVNFYNATGSLARFENKNISFSFEKRCRIGT